MHKSITSTRVSIVSGGVGMLLLNKRKKGQEKGDLSRIFLSRCILGLAPKWDNT